MKLSVIQGKIQEVSADTVIVHLFEEKSELSGAAAALDAALQGAIGELRESGDVTGQSGEVGVLYPRGKVPAKRVLVIGLGKQESFNLEAARQAGAAGIKKARDLGGQDVATAVPSLASGNLAIEALAQAVVEGSLLALYKYSATGPNTESKKPGVQSLTVVAGEGESLDEIEAGTRRAEALASGVYLTRELVNMPPNMATPSRLAEAAQEIAETYGMEITVGDRAWAAERKMGAFLSVGMGSREEPRFIVLEHNSERSDLDTVVLVGKGITFDSGGISIKPAERMGDMKSDMAGAAAVLGAMRVVGQLDLPLRVIAITPATENMPDGGAYHPADVITASNGKTIEIISTDAEGRMILADALVYARQYEPDAVVDLATLTGACVIALGAGVAAGLFCNDEELSDALLTSSTATHERLWPMPLYEDYRKSIRSDVADMKNSGGRMGGVGTSAVFLKEFTDYPWAHLDIAGMALTEKEGGYIPAGGTGFGVRLLIEFLRNWAE